MMASNASVSENVLLTDVTGTFALFGFVAKHRMTTSAAMSARSPAHSLAFFFYRRFLIRALMLFWLNATGHTEKLPFGAAHRSRVQA